jgi:septal ring factor EnvC (AmiA/AmiB activator)
MPLISGSYNQQKRRCDMKRNVIVVMAAVLMFMVVPAFSADTIDHQKEYQCQVEARKCMGDLSDAQAKMKKMNEKINKGAKYSEEDMMKLKKSISDLQQAIDSMKPMAK